MLDSRFGCRASLFWERLPLIGSPDWWPKAQVAVAQHAPVAQLDRASASGAKLTVREHECMFPHCVHRSRTLPSNQERAEAGHRAGDERPLARRELGEPGVED